MGCDIIVFAQIRGMAFRTHAIPVLAGIGPVQPITRIQRFIRIEMIPFLLAHIPGQWQALQAAAFEWHQILLQRIPSESVGDFIITHFTSRALGVNIKFATLAIESGRHTEMLKHGITEVSQNRCFRCFRNARKRGYFDVSFW